MFNVMVAGDARSKDINVVALDLKIKFRPKQNDRHFTDKVFKCSQYLRQNFSVLFISFVSLCPTNDKQSLVQAMP